MTTLRRASRRLDQVFSARQHNLPAPHMQLIGREQDSSTVGDLVLHAPGRMVALTGTGGCGKTQLALIVAAGLVDSFRNGAWLVELAQVQAPHLVPYAVATILGCRERSGEALINTIVAYLEERELLLVLDNCEHLIDACADLAERVLRGCPYVRLLATSRERLRISAETTWRVPSLASPDRRTSGTSVDLLGYPAVRLFVERARAVQSGFALRPGNASAVVDICARLEGLPLALELAAAHVSALALPQILERLDDSFRMLVGGSRTAHTRQQTMRATLDWSYGLLSAAEQVVFQRLAVFAGGWSLEAAEAVCADAMVAPADVFELLAHLVDKSLVVADEVGERSRYRLLEPVRQYAWGRLLASGELEAVRHRHASFFLAFAEALERDASVGGARRHTAADALELEYGNLQVALRRALDRQDAEVALRLAWTLQYVWKHRLPVGAGRPWLEEVLALPGAEAPTPARTVSLLTAAQIAWERADFAAADHYYAEAVPIARALADTWILFVALADQGNDAQQRGNYNLARLLWLEGLEVTRASGDRASEAILLGILGRLDIYQTKYAAGRARCEEALNLARQTGDVWITFMVLDGLGLAALAEGDLVAARALSNENLNVQSSSVLLAGSLFNLGHIEIADGQFSAARQHLFRLLELLTNGGDQVGTAHVLEALAHLAARLDQFDLALRLAAAAEVVQQTLGSVWSRFLGIVAPVSRDLRDRWLVPLLRTISPEDAARWWADGRALSLTEAVALAESELRESPSPAAPRAAADAGAPLTTRQLEVAVLVAHGLTNRQIAERLLVTERAAANHIEHILNKLGVGSRAQIAVWASQRGLLTTHTD